MERYASDPHPALAIAIARASTLSRVKIVETGG